MGRHGTQDEFTTKTELEIEIILDKTKNFINVKTVLQHLVSIIKLHINILHMSSDNGRKPVKPPVIL